MQAPRDIADSRFARGEISAEEHAAILAQLGPPPLPGAKPPPLPVHATPSAPPTKGVNIWGWLGAGVVLGIVILVVKFSSSPTEGLSLGNIHAEDSVVNVKVANTSSTAGDVLLWVEQGDISTCERVTRVGAQMSYTIQFACPSLQASQFTLRAKWASFDASKAAVAERID